MSGVLGIKDLAFVVGKTPDGPSLQIETDTVVVIVGPNNSGKSLALKEIENWCMGKDNPRKVIKSIGINFPESEKEAFQLLQNFKSEPPNNIGEKEGEIWVSQYRFGQPQPTVNQQINLNMFYAWTKKKDLMLRNNLLSFYTVRLDGRTRFSLTDPKPIGDLLKPPQNHLGALFVDDNAREEVRRLTNDAFPGNYFVVDPTSMKDFRIRLSPREPSTNSEEQGLDKDARAFHQNAPLINDFSDGVQGFVGLISAVLSLPHRVMLIDEPDAFLHPPLARRLGSNLTHLAGKRKASLVCATHSPEFLLGCMEADNRTTIVRLTYRNGISSSRNLSPNDVKEMATDPLLRSTDVLNALFHSTAVITESDTDRAFYDEVNRRLLSNGGGISDVIFLNAQNWQTVWRLIRPLRAIGIPAAGILDLDVIREGGKSWKDTLDACQIPLSERTELESIRASFVRWLNSQNYELKEKGIYSLPETERNNVDHLLSKLAKYGLFLVPVGEVEFWLKDLSVEGHGSHWLLGMFEKMGTSDNDPNYVKAGSGDVWDFINEIAYWSDNSNRLGT